MPIAHCIIADPALLDRLPENLVARWARRVDVNEDDITLNLFAADRQLGHGYPVMVNLYLPTLWNQVDIERIQLGLVEVISEVGGLSRDAIFVLTSLIQSGHVVDGGETVTWKGRSP